MKLIFFFIIFLVLLSSVSALLELQAWRLIGEWLTYNGNVKISGNLSVDGDYVNVTVVDFNITNNMNVAGNVTATNFFGNASSAIDDIWVNESGDTMTGDLIINTKVGIGTTTPSHALHVVGNVNLTGDNLYLSKDHVNISIIDADAGSLKIVENGVEYMTFDTTNGVEDIEIHQDFKMSGVGLQDYLQTVTGTSLTWQGLDSGVISAYSYFSGDGDATDGVSLNVFGRGTPDSVADREQLRIGWFPASKNYIIYTEAQGTGILRNLSIYTEGNPSQLRLLTDGNIYASGTSYLTGINGTAMNLVLGCGNITGATSDLCTLVDTHNTTADVFNAVDNQTFVSYDINTKNVNLTSYNLTTTECIVFESGGKICSG